MAAGNSRRFGSNKLLFPWKGKTMYRHGLDLLLELKKEMKEQLSVIVVTQYPEILEEVQKLPEASEVQVVFCKESHMGASYTIKAGIAAMQKQATYLLFMVADQPGTFQRKCQVSYEGIRGVGYRFRLRNRKRPTRDIITLLSWDSGESLACSMNP